MTIPASWRTPLICLGIVTAVSASIAIANPAQAETATVEIIWLMPAGGAPESPTYDQLWLPEGVSSIPCGMWGQGDWYLREEAARFAFDKRLTEGEDRSSEFPIRQMGVISWDFYYGGDCASGVDADSIAAAAFTELPKTGAEYSPYAYAAGGFALVGLASYLLLRSRRRTQKN